MTETEKFVMEAITLINDSITVDVCFDTKIVMNRLVTISAVGVLVKDLIALPVKKRPDNFMKILKELDGKIGELYNKMESLFNELKSFKVADEFYDEIGSQALSLFCCMKVIVSDPLPDNLKPFRAEYQRNPPLRLAREFMEKLQKDETNPLKLARDADKLKKLNTFKKLRSIIDGVLALFFVLETYLNGMFGNKDMAGPNKLAKEIKKMTDQIDCWNPSYFNDTPV